jgi:hypothetical protein
MVACIDFFEMSEICRPKFIVRHSTYLLHRKHEENRNASINNNNDIVREQRVVKGPSFVNDMFLTTNLLTTRKFLQNTVIGM